MSTVASMALSQRSTHLRTIAAGGTIIGLLHLIIQDWLVFSVLGQTPFVSVMQYVASGLLGNAAFAGGLATAMIGVLFHFVISFVIAGVFIMSASQIPLLRRNLIPGSLLYGLGAFIVMTYVVLPLSAAPLLPVQAIQTIELAVEHMLAIGLPLGLLVRRSAN